MHHFVKFGALVRIQGSKCSPSMLYDSPKMDRMPQAAQIRRQGPTAPEYSSTAFGEMKMPEPMMVPTIKQVALNSPTCANQKEQRIPSMKMRVSRKQIMNVNMFIC